jgi:hypothetical protein
MAYRISSIHIQNFRCFYDVEIMVNPEANIFTGVNNSGKTTVLEAVALWFECFQLMKHEAKKAVNDKKINAGDIVLGFSLPVYVDFESLNSVRSPQYEDLYYLQNPKLTITITLTFTEDAPDKGKPDKMVITFEIKNSNRTYAITLKDYKHFDQVAFRKFILTLRNSLNVHFATPVANILPRERFVTIPQIDEALKMRNGFQVIRNRLYQLYPTSYYQSFKSDVQYILTGYPSISPDPGFVKMQTESDINRDLWVDFIVAVGLGHYQRDLSLMGSGTIQIIELMLNVQMARSYGGLQVVLLDEPDSHIHRDIQRRLFERMLAYTSSSTGAVQFFVTTHNESLLRSIQNLNYIFHFHLPAPESKAITYHSILHQSNEQHQHKGSRTNVAILNQPMTRVYSDLGNDANGLSILEAVESHAIILCEGHSDAYFIDKLLSQFDSALYSRTKLTYWAIGGVSELYHKLKGYKSVFSAIGNAQSLWDKTVLVIDRDFMPDATVETLKQSLLNHFKLPAFIWASYNIEAVLLSDDVALADLLYAYCINSLPVKDQQQLDRAHILGIIQAAKQALIERLQTHFLEQEELNSRLVSSLFIELNKQLFQFKDIQLNETELGNHIRNPLSRPETIHPITRKEDIQELLQRIVGQIGIALSEGEIVTLQSLLPYLQSPNQLRWFDQWKGLAEFIYKAVKQQYSRS